MIKLIVTDIDGTLLPEGTDQLNPELYDVVRKLKEKGILFAAASGRQYASMLHIFQPVADDMIFLAENGSNVMCRGKNMSSNYMDEALAREAVLYLRTLKDCVTALSVPETMYLEERNQVVWDLLEKGYHNQVAYTEDLLSLCSHTNKLCAYRGEGIAPVADQIIERFQGRLNIMVSGRTWIDIMSMTADKGNALATIQKLMKISREETMAFGDNCNDRGMLDCAAESYAVANANPELKKAAKYIAPANTEDGVLRVIKEKILRE